MIHIFAAAKTFEMNGAALFFIIIGGVAIWLVMTFIFANLDAGFFEVVVDDEKKRQKGVQFIDLEDETQKEKEKAYRERQCRKEFLKRLKNTLKRTGVLLLESSWMVGLSIAVILTVYFITQNMLIE